MMIVIFVCVSDCDCDYLISVLWGENSRSTGVETYISNFLELVILVGREGEKIVVFCVKLCY